MPAGLNGLFKWALPLILVMGSLIRPGVLDAASSSGGRGGPFCEYHVSSLSSFDPTVRGNAFVVGGTGFAAAGKKFRVGGGGGGGFLWDSSLDVNFGMGYGGVIGEYSIVDWLSLQMMIGGGGYSLSKIISQTETVINLQKVSSGGFVLFYPSIVFEIPLNKFLALSGKLGYFLPNDGRLHSFTLGINILFGIL